MEIATATKTPTVASKRTSTTTQTIVFTLFAVILVLIIIWDLKRVQEISEVIHDDHDEMWVHLNDSGIKQWLSPLDQCLLKINDADIDVKSYRNHNCSKALVAATSMSNSVIYPPSQRAYCNIGASLGKVCPGPLGTRTYFTERLRDPRFSDPKAKYLSTALRYFASRNMPVIFIGDGLSKQNQDAMICDIMRLDKVIITSGTNEGSGTNNPNDLSYFTDYLIKWKEDKKLKLELKYFKLTNIVEPESDEEEDPIGFDFDMNWFGSKSKMKERVKRGLTRSPSSRSPNRMKDKDHLRKRNYTNHHTPVPQSQRHLLAMNNTRTVANHAMKGNHSRARMATNKYNVTSGMMKRGFLLHNPEAVGNLSVAGKGFHAAPRKPASKSTLANDSSIILPKPTPSTPTNSTGVSRAKMFSFPQIKTAIEKLIEATNRSVVIIANAGVWYNSRERFRKELPHLLSWLNDLGKDEERQHLIFYRETAAQHWNHTASGYYDREYRENANNNGTCIPIADNSPGKVRFSLDNNPLNFCFTVSRT